MVETTFLNRNVRILVADEPVDWAREFVEDFHSGSIDVEIAGDDRQGLEIVRQKQIDLAVIAGDHPHLGGLDLVRRVHWLSEELPVIVLAGRIDPRWLQEALKIGVRAVLPKPVNVNRLVEISVKILKNNLL